MENNAAKRKIATYIFMDFETTSLTEKPRVTELCLLAVNRMDMEKNCVFPRVINKLTLCLNPGKPISYIASNLTGLYNDSLEHQKSFTANTTMLINCFISHLNQPVCLLAHNGNNFDFPILVAELKRINDSLESVVFCADTLETFRSLDGLPYAYSPMVNRSPANNNKSVEETTQLKTPSSCTISSSPPCHKQNENLNSKTKCSLNPNTTLYIIPQNFNEHTSDRNFVRKKLKFEDVKDAVPGSSKEPPTKKDNETNVANACSSYGFHMYDESPLNRKNVATNDKNKNIPVPDLTDQKCDIPVLESDAKQCDIQVLDSGDKKCDIRALEAGDNKCDIQALKSDDSFNESWKDSELLPVLEINCNQSTKKSKEFSNVGDGTEKILKTCINLDFLESDITNGSGYYIRKHSDAAEVNIRSTNAINNHYQLSEPISSTSVTPLQGNNSNYQLACPPAVLKNMAPRVPTTTHLAFPLKQPSYKLQEIFTRIYGFKPPTHRAEDDCITLVKIAVQTPGFIKWIDDNAVLLKLIQPAY